MDITKTVMVCDDDPGILEVIKIILEENNYKVIALSSGKGIQKRIEEQSPDIIFLDLWMPGIEGKEITRVLKKDPQTKDIPIVIISALAETKNIASVVGADGFLAKPFEINELLNTIKRFC